MKDFDLSKIPYGGRISQEDQIEFERRARIADDNNNPPIVIDEEGTVMQTIEDLLERFDSKSEDLDYWVALKNDMEQFMSEDHPAEEKQMLGPIGPLESVTMLDSWMKYDKEKSEHP